MMMSQKVVQRHALQPTRPAEPTIRSIGATDIGRNPTARIKVYPFGAEGYSEAISLTQDLEIGDWTTIDFRLPGGLGAGPLRIDPADVPCLVELGALSVWLEPDTLLFEFKGASARSPFFVSGTASVLVDENRFLLFSYGSDPQVILPSLPFDKGEVRVEVTLRVDFFDVTSNAVISLIQSARAAAELEVSGMRAELTALNSERNALATELSRVVAERNELVQDAHAVSAMRVELAASHSERTLLASQSKSIAIERDNLRAELNRTNGMLAQALPELEFARESLRITQRTLEVESDIRHRIEHSKSWRVTEPIRRFMSLLRSISYKGA
jgi:hypothetical protein